MTALLDATRTVVHDALGIGDRVRHGDPLVGWEGDDTYTLYYRRGSDEPYQVWAENIRGEPYLVLSAQHCDARILHRLRDSHWTNMVESNRAGAREQEDRYQQGRADQLDRLHEGTGKFAYELRDHKYTFGWGD